MRIPDNYLQRSFMTTFNKSKANLAEIQTRLTTQSMVNKPSDNPLSNARIMRMHDQLSTIETYKSNISYANSTLDDSIISIEAMQNEILNVQVQLTQLNSAIVNDDLSSFAESIDASIEIMLELANSQFNGQYNFSGTGSNKKPFTYDEASNKVVSNSSHLGGDRVVKISSGITQKFNISGKELFQSVFTQAGNLDSTAGVGVPQTDLSKVYDAEGNEYDMALSYTMTEANTYDLNYTITDKEGNVIDDQTVADIKFNADDGSFESIGGDKFGEIKVQNSDNKIDFIIDLNSLTEKGSAETLRNDQNQKADIFNTLIAIKDKIEAGEKPSDDQVSIVNDFYQHLLNVDSKAGGISIKLNATEEILISKEVEIASLLSLEKDVDVLKALHELESAQYTLDVSYKISSMLLPKSLMDFF